MGNQLRIVNFVTMSTASVDPLSTTDRAPKIVNRTQM